MSCELGLSVGEAFAELSEAPNATPAFKPARWYLPRRSLTEGLKERLAPVAAGGGCLHVLSTRADFGVGPRPALLVTAGCESWLKRHGTIAPEWPSHHAARGWSPLDDDTTFGISERMAADGSVLKDLDLTELEFLISKFSLLGIKQVAVCFMHSTVNPKHELAAVEFLNSRGVNAVPSHLFANLSDERTRWAQTILSALIRPAQDEQMEDIKAALGEEAALWNILQATDHQTAHSQWTHLRKLSAQPRKNSLLYLGLECFWLLRPDLSSLDTQPCHLFTTRPAALLSVQPGQMLMAGFWPTPTLAPLSRGPKPGPMAFGKSLQPTVLDVFYLMERLQPIEGFTSLIADKSRPRILEAMLTLARRIPNLVSSQSPAIASDLENFIVERLLTDLMSRGTGEHIEICGALAASLAPLLKARRPQVQWKTLPDSEWSESRWALPATSDTGSKKA